MNDQTLHLIGSLAYNGATTQLTHALARLASSGPLQHVAFWRGANRAKQDFLDDAGVITHRLPVSRLPGEAAWHVRRLIRRVRPARVHCWSAEANRVGWTATLASGDVQLLLSCRALASRSGPSPLGLPVRWVAASGHPVVANSRLAANRLTQRGLPQSQIHIVPNGVPLANRSDTSARRVRCRRQLREELNLAPDHRLLIAVGPLQANKGLKDLIWATDLLKVVRDDVHLLIVGSGPYRWRVERFRAQVRVSRHVHLLGDRDDVPRLLRAADVFCLAGHHESLNNGLLEAMAHGCPAVVSDIPGNRQAATDGRSCLMVPPGDRGGFARHLLRLLDSPELAAALADEAYRQVGRAFPIATTVQRLSQVHGVSQAASFRMAR